MNMSRSSLSRDVAHVLWPIDHVLWPMERVL